MSDAPAVLLADVPQSNALLHTLLDISLTGVLLLRPLFAEAAEAAPLVDFAYVHLNPAAQQMLQLPACPAESFLTLFPTAQDAGVFGFYRDTFLSGRVGHHQQNYQFDGLDGYYRLVAQRQEQLLVISFTDTNDQPRTAVEQALRTSQAREQQARAEAETQRGALQRLFAQAPVPMALFEGPDYRIELANESMAAVWGSTISQFVGLPVFEALPFVRGQGFEAIFAEVLLQGTPYDLYEVLVTFGAAPASRQGFFNLTYRPQRDAHGRITGIITSAYEVTEQVEARRHVEQLNQQLEAARAEAERERAQLQALLTQAPVAIALLQGEDLRVVSANALMAELWGSTPAQVVGQPLLKGVPELQGQGFDDLLRQVLHTQVPHTGAETPAVMLRHGQLQTSYFDFVYHPLYEADGQVLGVIIVATDMTEQVLARRQVEQLNAELDTRVQARTADLQESEGRFRTMADTAPAMLWVTDPDGQCTYLNAQWYQYTGQTEAEALGMGWTQAVHPDDAALAGQKFLDANAQRAQFYVRYRLRRHDGVYRWAVDAGSPHFAEDGAYAGIVGTVIDIHEQQLAEDELLATNEQLRRTNVDLDNFIYTASHDLKAPITNIEGLLLALEHELPAAARPGDVPLMLTMMQEAIERFRRTITHLTDLSRLQKEHNPTSAAVALAPVVEAVRLDLGPLLTHTQGQLTVTIPEGLTVTFAEKNLRSVVYNLLSNALKYHHPDRRPVVHLRSWLADGYAVLEVQDNGLGLDLSQGQEQLFAMFQRLHTHVEGTGIGLYMVKRILENAGGRIEVSSQLGQGSTFRVYFRR